ncbi:hypothetical protein P3L10_016943 [Capsicum annuum]
MPVRALYDLASTKEIKASIGTSRTHVANNSFTPFNFVSIFHLLSSIFTLSAIIRERNGIGFLEGVTEKLHNTKETWIEELILYIKM